MLITGELYTFGRFPMLRGFFMIDKYIAKHYEWPPCWQLVADVYVNELGYHLMITHQNRLNARCG